MELKIKNKAKYSGGFTLAETMISLAIVGLILVVGVSVFAFGPRSFSNQVNSLSNQYRVRDVARNISRDARKADADSIIAVPEYLQIAGINYTFNSGSVYRDGIEISGGIETFSYTMIEGRLNVEISSTDSGGESFSLTVDILVRRAD